MMRRDHIDDDVYATNRSLPYLTGQSGWPGDDRMLRRSRVCAGLLGVAVVIGFLFVSVTPASATAPSPTWTQQSPAASPSARAQSAMVHDPASLRRGT
jgi:hypothetical protein